MPEQSIFRCSHFILISVCVILTLSNNFVVGNINQPTTRTNNSTNHTGNDTEHEDHGIHIVSWRFSELSGPIIISIFMLAVSILKVSKYHEHKRIAVADPGFSPGGCVKSQNCYYFSNFCRKLHEN